jgi:hypothetical protein
MKKKHIYIHAGTTKTGTSSIQGFLTDNENILKQHNFTAFVPKGAYGLRTLVDNIFDVARNRLLAFNEKQQQYLDDLVTKLKNTKTDNIILSEELFWNIISYHKEIPIFKDFINSLKEFADITVVVYFRRQDSFLMSVYQQRLKTGGKMEGKDCQQWILMSERPQTGITNLRGNLEWFTALLGKENIIVRPFENEQFINQSLFADFMHCINLPMKKEFEIKDKRKNPGLSPAMAEILRYLSIYYDDRKSIYPLITQKYKSNDKLFNQGRQHKFLSPKERIDIIQCCAADNEWVAREFLGREDGVLFKESLPDINEPWEKYKLNFEEVKTFFSAADFSDEKQKEIMQKQVLKALDMQSRLSLKFYFAKIIRNSPLYLPARILKQLMLSFSDKLGEQS